MFKMTPILSNSVILNTTNLTYVSDGDTNDVLYFIGTLNNTTTFTNPQLITNSITVTINTLSSGTASNLTDRGILGFGTTDVANSSAVINLNNGRSLVINKYSLRARNIGTTYIRNWKLQASNDGSTWTDVDTQTSNTTIAAASGWVSITVTGQTVSYQYWRVLQTGLNASSTNVLTLGEIQLYGSYSYYS